MPTIDEIVQEIEKLSGVERIKVVDRVLRDTIKPDTEIEAVWVRESSARWDAFVQGRVEAGSYAEVMNKYRANA